MPTVQSQFSCCNKAQQEYETSDLRTSHETVVRRGSLYMNISMVG